MDWLWNPNGSILYGASSGTHNCHYVEFEWNPRLLSKNSNLEQCARYLPSVWGNGTFTSSPNNTWNTSFYLTVLTNRVPGNSTTSLLLWRRKWISNDTHLLLLLQLWRNFCLTRPYIFLLVGNQVKCKLHLRAYKFRFRVRPRPVKGQQSICSNFVSICSK